MNPEQWLSLKWNGGSTMSDRWLNQSKIIHIIEILKKDEKIEELLYDLIVQVVQITNRVVHGQDVDDQYIGFVKKIYPDMVNMINKIGRNLKSEGNKNKILRSQGH